MNALSCVNKTEMKRSLSEEASEASHKRPRAESSVIDLTGDVDNDHTTDHDSDATEIMGQDDPQDKGKASTSPTFVNPRIFLTRVRDLDSFENLGSKSLRDLLSVKPLECMLQFNYMVELSWLMSHLPNKTIPVTFVHGFRGESLDYLREEASHFPNVRLVIPNLPIAYGTHHTKMMCLFYVDGDAQVIIHTANMISRDWGNKTQGMWVSPMLHRKLGTGSCQFESDFSEYLAAYGSSMRHWRERLQTYDYTQCKATLVASVPGRHTGNDMYKWGHLKLRRSLEKVSIPEALRAKSLLIAQFSSVGSLGTSDEWLMQELGNSLSACRNKQLGSNLPMKLIFPTIDNVRTSLEGWAGGGSLPFDTKNWVKQESYMRPRLCVWEANEAGRPRAVPHIKTYTRIDPESGEMGWFLLSSSNLSKAAWGSVEKKGTQIMIRSYELGVLIVSDDFKTDSTQKAVLQAVTVAGLATIHPKDSPSPTDASLVVPIRLPYDIPLTPYKPHDVPWTKDSLDESLASELLGNIMFALQE